MKELKSRRRKTVAKEPTFLKIQKGIPFTGKKRYQWDFLEKIEDGDSVLFPDQSGGNAARMAATARGIVPRSHTVKGGVRVWFFLTEEAALNAT